MTYFTVMTITVELALQAFITAAFVLAALAIPKLIAYFLWAIYKICIFKGMSRIIRSKSIRRWIKGDLYKELVKVSDSQSARIKQIVQTYSDYTRDIKEPLVEAITAVVLVLYVSPLVEQSLLFFFQVLAVVLIVFVFISTLMVLIIIREANKLKKEPQENAETENKADDASS